ncbi:MAG: thiamine pyrophosphate-binding protein [Pseudomonadota bacterium]
MKLTVADYLISKLKENDCHHVFGIPGTSCSGFFNAVEEASDFEYILTSNELEAGYMADGYGRQNTIGAVCVSYGVGILSLTNAVASALTERVPMVVLNGGPRASDWDFEDKYGVLFSHSTGRRNTDFNVMSELCVAAELLTDPSDYQSQIDGAFDAAVTDCGPVYIELAQDQWSEKIEISARPHDISVTSSTSDDFVARLGEALKSAKKPVVMLGTELQRLGLEEQISEWLAGHNLPYVTTLLSKANVLSESHPQYRGVYDSDLAPKLVRTLVEDADLVLALGIVFGIDHKYMLDKQTKNVYSIGFGIGRIGAERFEGVSTKYVVNNLPSDRIYSQSGIRSDYQAKRKKISDRNNRATPEFGFASIFGEINRSISDSTSTLVVTVDTCLASYPAADLDIPAGSRYLSNPVWLAIGQGTPAGTGAYFASGHRPLIITGDGGFQMVAQTISTMVRYKVPAIIIVLDNGTYAIEQFLIDGSYFTDDSPPLDYTVLHSWRYGMLAQSMGAKGVEVDSNETFRQALTKAVASSDTWLISAKLLPNDLPRENWIWLEERS